MRLWKWFERNQMWKECHLRSVAVGWINEKKLNCSENHNQFKNSGAGGCRSAEEWPGLPGDDICCGDLWQLLTSVDLSMFGQVNLSDLLRLDAGDADTAAERCQLGFLDYFLCFLTFWCFKMFRKVGGSGSDDHQQVGHPGDCWWLCLTGAPGG